MWLFSPLWSSLRDQERYPHQREQKRYPQKAKSKIDLPLGSQKTARKKGAMLADASDVCAPKGHLRTHITASGTITIFATGSLDVNMIDRLASATGP